MLTSCSATTVAVIIRVDRDSVCVLDQENRVREFTFGQVTTLETRKNVVATDRNGAEIRPGDTVKEVSGAARQGVILHVSGPFVFIRDQLHEVVTTNNGCFVARTSNIATIVAKGGRISTGTPSAAPDFTKMNPATMKSMPPPAAMPKHGSFLKAIGQTVIIRTGPYKGLLGIVRDANERHVCIELHTKGKSIYVEKHRLGFREYVVRISLLNVFCH